VKDFKVGDRVAALMPVMGSQWGAAAEFAVVKASFLGKIGKLTGFESAALVPLVSLTAVTALEKIEEPQGKKVKSQPLTRTSLASHLAVQKGLPPTPIMSSGHTL
jgi:NADPH:quinone reductase-like Zn-dependent oxidoreductase